MEPRHFLKLEHAVGKKCRLRYGWFSLKSKGDVGILSSRFFQTIKPDEVILTFSRNGHGFAFEMDDFSCLWVREHNRFLDNVPLVSGKLLSREGHVIVNSIKCDTKFEIHTLFRKQRLFHVNYNDVSYGIEYRVETNRGGVTLIERLDMISEANPIFSASLYDYTIGIFSANIECKVLFPVFIASLLSFKVDV